MIQNGGLDIKSASAGPGAIVFEQFGEIHLYDLNSNENRKVSIHLDGDLLEVRPHFQKIEPKRIRFAGISPSGARAVFGVRGEILTVPSEKGDIRNLTNTPAVAERDPAWSPDGKSIAYFSDESGEYALHVRDQSGMGEVRKIDLGSPPSFYYSPVWSPDSQKIAYADKRLSLWYVSLESKKPPVKVDTDTYAGPGQLFNPAWSTASCFLTQRAAWFTPTIQGNFRCRSAKRPRNGLKQTNSNFCAKTFRAPRNAMQPLQRPPMRIWRPARSKPRSVAFFVPGAACTEMKRVAPT